MKLIPAIWSSCVFGRGRGAVSGRDHWRRRQGPRTLSLPGFDRPAGDSLAPPGVPGGRGARVPRSRRATQGAPLGRVRDVRVSSLALQALRRARKREPRARALSSPALLSPSLTSDVGYWVGWCWARRSSFSMCIRVVLPALSRPCECVWGGGSVCVSARTKPLSRSARKKTCVPSPPLLSPLTHQEQDLGVLVV